MLIRLSNSRLSVVTYKIIHVKESGALGTRFEVITVFTALIFFKIVFLGGSINCFSLLLHKLD
jgi:hypothetical protein